MPLRKGGRFAETRFATTYNTQGQHIWAINNHLLCKSDRSFDRTICLAVHHTNRLQRRHRGIQSEMRTNEKSRTHAEQSALWIYKLGANTCACVTMISIWSAITTKQLNKNKQKQWPFRGQDNIYKLIKAKQSINAVHLLYLYRSVCVCVRACARVRAYVCVRVCACVCVYFDSFQAYTRRRLWSDLDQIWHTHADSPRKSSEKTIPLVT